MERRRLGCAAPNCFGVSYSAKQTVKTDRDHDTPRAPFSLINEKLYQERLLVIFPGGSLETSYYRSSPLPPPSPPFSR